MACILGKNKNKKNTVERDSMSWNMFVHSKKSSAYLHRGVNYSKDISSINANVHSYLDQNVSARSVKCFGRCYT